MKMTTFSKLAQWILISVLVIGSLATQSALAQSEDDAWAEPLNLSHSGTATNSTVVIDSDGGVHAIWQDDFANFVYARQEAGVWSTPQETNLHYLLGRSTIEERSASTEWPGFSSTNPLFVSGPGQFIFAVWITPEGILYGSHAPNNAFADVEGWTGTNSISSSVIAFAAAVDINGDLHVTYITTEEDGSNPAGIYYVRYRSNNRGWTEPVLLYASPYFRSLAGTPANIGLTTAGTAEAPGVYVVWDNQSRKQVFLAKSLDGGWNWEEAIQIAGPLPDSGSDGPFNLRVGAKENTVVLVWQSGQPESTCSQYSQFSTDAGSTWSTAQLMFDRAPGCARINEFVSTPANNPGTVLFLLTSIQDHVYLSAWDGQRWSLPQAQPLLTSFEDPEIYSQVEYGCYRAAVYGEQLYVVGCDLGGGGDIWVTSRSIASTADWFNPPVWSQPALIISDGMNVGGIEMVATSDNLIHAFLIQQDDPSVYYARWDGTIWSRIAPVMKLPTGEVSQSAVAAGANDELFLLARSSTGSLYFSRANSVDAITPSSWSTPVHLPIPHDGKISPADVASGAGKTVFITYSVPVNDDRGIYLVQSNDRGETWSAPLKVFDGAVADFAVVGSPSLQVTDNGSVYLVWKQESVPADGLAQPISLYFARSEDGGKSFSKAERVVEAPLGWRALMSDNQGNLHWFWQKLDTMKTISDQVSTDGGHTWEAPEVFPTEDGIATVVADSDGGLHLISFSHDQLNYWSWDQGRWQSEPPARWSPVVQDHEPVEILSASVNANDELAVIFVVPVRTGESVEKQIFYSTRTFSPSTSGSANRAIPNQITLSPAAAPITAPAQDLQAASTSPDQVSIKPLSAAQNVTANNPVSLFAEVLLPLLLLLIGVMIVIYLRSVWSKAG